MVVQGTPLPGLWCGPGVVGSPPRVGWVQASCGGSCGAVEVASGLTVRGGWGRWLGGSSSSSSSTSLRMLFFGLISIIYTASYNFLGRNPIHIGWLTITFWVVHHNVLGGSRLQIGEPNYYILGRSNGLGDISRRTITDRVGRYNKSGAAGRTRMWTNRTLWISWRTIRASGPIHRATVPGAGVDKSHSCGRRAP